MIEREIVRSIISNGVASSTASFLSNQTDVDRKRERLNELLIEINSAIEFAKAHELILNSSLREWLDDLQKASKEGEQVQSAFRERDIETQSIIPWKAAVRLYERSRRVNRLNAIVTRLERKASNCEKFRQMLRDEINEQRDQTCTERVEKLERKVARLRNSLKAIRSNGLFMKRKKSKHAHGLRRGHHNAITISEPKFGDHNDHDEPEEKEDPSSEQEIQQQRPHERLTTVPKFGKWGDINSSPSTVGFEEIFKGLRTVVKATPVQVADKPVLSPGRDRDDALFLSGPTARPVPEFGEWEEQFTSHYTIDFDKCKMEGKTAPDEDPCPIPPPPPLVQPVCTPRRNAYRNETSFLSRIFACISLKTRN